MFKLAAKEEKMIKTAFAKKSNAVLAEEIEDITLFRASVLNYAPDHDVSELDYYIQLRKDSMK